MHVATNKPNIVELNAGASKVKAGWSKTKGWRILTRYLAAEPNVIIEPHPQFKREFFRSVCNFSTTVHANHREESYDNNSILLYSALLLNYFSPAQHLHRPVSQLQGIRLTRLLIVKLVRPSCLDSSSCASWFSRWFNMPNCRAAS